VTDVAAGRRVSVEWFLSSENFRYDVKKSRPARTGVREGAQSVSEWMVGLNHS
jgi:hypothetical protein